MRISNCRFLVVSTVKNRKNKNSSERIENINLLAVVTVVIRSKSCRRTLISGMNKQLIFFAQNIFVNDLEKGI